MTNPYVYMSRPNLTTDEFLEIDWAMFGELCRALALKVARDYDPEIIVGIARAGVIPGAVIASILRADFYSMKISRREAAFLLVLYAAFVTWISLESFGLIDTVPSLPPTET